MMRSAYEIVIAAFVNRTRMHSAGLLLQASNPRERMSQKINNIVLVGRASENTRSECSETSRPSLKTRGKMEPVSISQERSRHGGSQSIGAVWFIANAVRNHDRRISSGRGIDVPSHVVPRVSGSCWFREANKLESAGRTKLIRKRSREPLG